jgi:hypothetical protein
MSRPIDLALVRQGDQLLASAYALAGDHADVLARRQAEWSTGATFQEDIMSDETPRRGRPRKAEHSTQTMIRMAPDLLRRIEDYRQRTEATMPGLHLTMADAVRMLLELGLAGESHSTTVHTQQYSQDIYKFTENTNMATASVSPAPPVQAVESQPMTDIRHAPETAASQTHGPDAVVELPKHIQDLAELRSHYDKLSLTELAQLAFDRGIYRATGKDGTQRPANRGNLQKWLERARQAGML